MSVAQFSRDLTKPGLQDEPRESSNAGMNTALLLAVALSLFTVLAGIYGPSICQHFKPVAQNTASADY